MKRSTAILVLVVLGGATLAVLWLSRSRAAGASALSPSGSGWLAARRYLRERGRDTALSDQPFTAGPAGAIVTVFPWEGPLEDAEEVRIRTHVFRGGDLVIGYSGSRIDQAETDLFDHFGIALHDVRGEIPLSPLAWYRYRTEVWRLTPASDMRRQDGAVEEVICLAPRRIPVAPSGARTILSGPGGVAAVFLLGYGRGRILVLPADTLSNARLDAGANADLLESAGRMLSGRIVFDEYHHGLRSPGQTPGGASPSFDLWIAQLLLMYTLAVLALGRRLGRPWREEPPRAGTTASFLLGLAARHRVLKHYPAAARLLVSRATRLDPAIRMSPELAGAAETADEKTLLGLAAALSRRGRRETAT
jgi:uncharacterized protein DUF4350